jgi:type I restriction enzyme R subunit
MSDKSSASDYSEDKLVEKPALELLEALGWEIGNLFGEWTGDASCEGRASDKQVILPRRLRKALEGLNPILPPAAIDQAMEALTLDRSRLVPAAANRELYRLLRDGVKVTMPDPRGGSTTDTARVIDWRTPEANAFFAASQLWLRGQVYRRRADVVGFVNGIPLAFMEFKATGIPVRNAYDDNLTDYRHAVPQLFTPNAFVILSNGAETRIGSAFAPWEHFNEWKKIDDEAEPGVVSLETVLRGVCDKARMLDLVENFTVFEDTKDGLVKKIARNHQYLGVNNAIRALGRVNERPAGEAGRLGVFWHTQGSGKSLSMVFFTQKILRTIPGNWTFAIITDRTDLEDQIHKTFVVTGAVTETKARAEDGEDLKRLLREDHRYTLSPAEAEFDGLTARSETIQLCL